MRQRLLYIFGFLTIILLISIINFRSHGPIFTTPDEASNYLIVKEYGTNGNMYLNDTNLNIDFGNNLHSRGFLSYNGKIVPFSFLGLPLIYGTFYTILGDTIAYINIVLMIISILLILKILQLFEFKINKGIIFLGIISCLPLLYYFNLPYYNIVPAVPFALALVYFIFKFNKVGDIKYLYLGVFFSVVLIWIRYEQVIFVLIFLLLNFIQNYKSYTKQKNKILHIFMLLGMAFCTFVLPLFILNKQLYGDSFTYGYSLFTKLYFAQERTGSFLTSLINILSPGATFDLKILWINIKNNLFLISPVFYLLSALFIFKKSFFKKISIYRILIIYLILYQIMSPTYGSGIDIVTIHNSINRYIIYIHILLSFYLMLFLTYYFNRYIKTIVSCILMVFSIGFLAKSLSMQITSLNSLYNMKEYINSTNATYLLTPVFDKITNLKTKPITRQNGGVNPDEYFYKTSKELSNTIIYLIKKGEKIYTVEDKNRFNIINHFEEIRKNGIGFTNITGNIYQLYLINEEE